MNRSDVVFLFACGAAVSLSAYMGGASGAALAGLVFVMGGCYARRTADGHRIAAQSAHIRAMVIEANERSSVLNMGYPPAEAIRLAGYLHRHQVEAERWA